MYKQNKIIRMNKCAVCMCTCFFARSAIERAACMFGLRYSSSSFIKTPPGDPGMARQSHYLGSTLGGGEVGGEGINQSIPMSTRRMPHPLVSTEDNCRTQLNQTGHSWAPKESLQNPHLCPTYGYINYLPSLCLYHVETYACVYV